MIYVLSFWSDVAFSIKQALRTFSCTVAAVIYNFIVDLYNVFMYTARAEILESSFIQGIYNKVGMILGIFMVFKLSFSLIQSLVDPSKFTDEKKGFGGIIKRSVISIVLLGITPSIFNMAFDLQNLVVGSANNTDNIIYKLIVGKAPSKDAESFGHVIASELYFGFYTENEPLKLNQGLEVTYPDSGGVQLEVHDYEYLKTQILEDHMSFSDTVDYISITNAGQYVIKWDGLFAIGFGLFMVYILITYCISVATRVIQLAYLQLIAPVPILSYISDPEGSFKNWTKQCMTTYLDLFIRLAIIYFIITVSTQILQAFSEVGSVFYESTGLEAGSGTAKWVSRFLIIGLLMFGKRVPELLKDLFPNFGGGAASIGFGLKNPKKMLGDIPGMGIAKGAATFGLGTVVGGAAGMASGIKNGYGVRGKIAGAFGGFNRGIAGGAKTKGNIFKNVQGGMSSTRQARQRALDKQMYKIDNSKLNKEYQDNEAIIAAKKAIDDRAESELLKTDTGAQAAQARLNYIETNVGKVDAVTGRTITTADVVAQKATYKAYMDSAKETWVNTNASNDKDIAKQMQIIQNKTGKTISNYNSVSTAATTAKNENITNARKITNDEYNKEKMQQKKSKIK
jgi:membrane protein